MKIRVILFILFCFPNLRAQVNFIPWVKLENPVYSKVNWSVKDACMFYDEKNKEFNLFFSAFFEVEDRVNSHIVAVKTKDWLTFSEALFIWDGKDLGYYGICSPEIHYYEGKYILTYNGWGDKAGIPNQLYYAVSDNLIDWKKDIPLASEITKGYRAIDAAS